MAPRNHPAECTLCRKKRLLEFHHLIPRKIHRRTFYRRNFTRKELSIGIWICRFCHKGLHKIYSEMELAKNFHDLERLRKDSKIQRHVTWAKKQKTAEV